MDKNALEAAIKAAEHELTKLTYETIRPNQAFKMRTHSPIISSIIACKEYYERELAKLDKKPKTK